MSRQFDLASDLELQAREDALASTRATAQRETPAPSGVCPWCEDIAPASATFCGAECASDWQAHHARERRAAIISGAK
ncbi:hypothetical protein GCM10007860_06180 [Chitiniphilus shinanonensis]|uniref:DUF2116 family Zn-ribbon domain-containing protein n=1 Tax=Chitiniphilus shinanonensis TaxID=553088 RepID=A0ABQ6BUJ1_9NEIS|nr:hypothetical protein [Chitiniphilus shinanonensis]GLS03474.1 hypothetical protein GCM10007860_06180 [Chitiniphilus shinanonensis]